ncbi:hypothetical protein [Pleionea sp. CnH1-48]|uniref:hypothetical protein n=1 Tax=Pleionea sp. CnH1-48 TaxID=2954494 RepID=UPI002097D7D5|nr:hypothetical protein [Pleionea sp. CnH1-48]MCO7222951.1 hypothetical protein [Pleionea sp. CnH1-48]
MKNNGYKDICLKFRSTLLLPALLNMLSINASEQSSHSNFIFIPQPNWGELDIPESFFDETILLMGIDEKIESIDDYQESEGEWQPTSIEKLDALGLLDSVI